MTCMSSAPTTASGRGGCCDHGRGSGAGGANGAGLKRWRYADSIGDFIPREEKYSRSPWWNCIGDLKSAGIVSAADGSIHQPNLPSPALPPGRGLWQVGSEPPKLLIEYVIGAASEIPQFQLARIGIELGSLLPRPDVAAKPIERG